VSRLCSPAWPGYAEAWFLQIGLKEMGFSGVWVTTGQ